MTLSPPSSCLEVRGLDGHAHRVHLPGQLEVDEAAEHEVVGGKQLGGEPLR